MLESFCLGARKIPFGETFQGQRCFTGSLGFPPLSELSNASAGLGGCLGVGVVKGVYSISAEGKLVFLLASFFLQSNS